MSQIQYATLPRLGRSDAKLLSNDDEIIGHYQLSDLAALLDKDSLIVVNDAATLPGRLMRFVGSLPVEL